MKPLRYYILTTILFAISFTGCRVAPTNGDLDGLWQITAIVFNETGEEQQPDQLYYAIYRNLIQLKKGGDIIATGELVLSDNNLHLNFLDFTSVESEVPIINLGINTINPVFHIVELNSRHMILTSDYATKHFRRC